jgi:hypothetical protein
MVGSLKPKAKSFLAGQNFELVLIEKVPINAISFRKVFYAPCCLSGDISVFEYF